MLLNIMGRFRVQQRRRDNFRIVARFVARKGEKIFGMGQYQQHELDSCTYAGAGTEKLTGQCSVLSFPVSATASYGTIRLSDR